MTNKEKYKKAFSTILPPKEIVLEVEKMKKIRKQYIMKTITAAMIGCAIFMASATAAYAMDVGGIRRTIQLWIQGNRTDVTIQFDGDGTYEMEYMDADGNMNYGAGGGVAIEADGSTTPLSEEELMEELMMPDVEYKEDGSVWVYWLDQKVEITDKFVDDFCYVELINGEEHMYVTVKYQDGYAVGSKYEDPDSWISD